MMLGENYLRPFDRTYAAVTADIQKQAAQLPSPSSDWLLRLVVTFQQERSLWNTRPELLNYRLRWARFRTKVLHLVAGAYLHIAYDLPRALADDWPGQANWVGGPPKSQGQAIYLKLGDIFPENLDRSARDFGTIGFPALILRSASKKALRSAGVWVDALRKGAWLHAEVLATAPNRALREAKMAEAITAALEDASELAPWSIGRLTSPDNAIYSSFWAMLLIMAEYFRDLFTTIIPMILAFVVSNHRSRENDRIEGAGAFVDLWGYLTHDYVSYAVRDPEDFAAYRERRTSELGVLARRAVTLNQ